MKTVTKIHETQLSVKNKAEAEIVLPYGYNKIVESAVTDVLTGKTIITYTEDVYIAEDFSDGYGKFKLEVGIGDLIDHDELYASLNYLLEHVDDAAYNLVARYLADYKITDIVFPSEKITFSVEITERKK